MLKTKNAIPFSHDGFSQILQDILQWWSKEMPDKHHGGFIGRVGGNGIKYPKADKSIILHSRILWTFSKAINNGHDQYRDIAHQAYQYLVKYFIDHKNGGLFWMLDFQGTPISTQKQIYAQAFGIYAFSEYFMATGYKEVLNETIALFEILEEIAYDKKYDGYLEAFSENWQPIDDVRLSKKDANDVKTMNTHLHILEAYTNLYKCHKSEKVKYALTRLIHLYCEKFVEIPSGRLKLFFDEQWNENMTHHSYGHGIESGWLLSEASEAIGDKTLIYQIREYALALSNRVLQEGLAPNGGIYNEKFLDGTYDQSQDWWPQAEAVIGFFDAYLFSKNDVFLNHSQNCFNFICNNLIDYKNGEWYWSVDQNGIPNTNEEKAGPWKAPYHNSRMCFEMIERLKKNKPGKNVE
jgi:mannobiose 2-epimerase